MEFHSSLFLFRKQRMITKMLSVCLLSVNYSYSIINLFTDVHFSAGVIFSKVLKLILCQQRMRFLINLDGIMEG